MAVLVYANGDTVPSHFNKGLIAASFFVSLSGSVTAMELLHRRSVRKGWRNWLQLLSCAISMGVVGTWAMHFCANYSIVLGNGAPELQLVYSPGQTAGSCFIPVAAMFVAFCISDFRYQGRMQFLLSLFFSGTFMGLAMAGMHYTGNLAISNYHAAFRPANVVGAITIACVTSIAALALLFWLQELWLTVFVYRLLCAILFAGAVSSMHWVGSLGTTYTLSQSTDPGSNSRTTNFIIAIALALLTLPACIAAAISTSRRERELADRAQQVVLAVVHFDPDGRLLIKQDGDLPAHKITTDQNNMAFDDNFDTRHPVFHWIYRASNNWKSVERFVPAMRRHLHSARYVERQGRKFDIIGSSASTGSVNIDEDTLGHDDYATLFREAFCVAACNLALELSLDLNCLGVLGDAVLMTGTSSVAKSRSGGSVKDRIKSAARTAAQDVAEASVGVDVFGKGQLLMLAKQCSKREATMHMADGYRFAPLDRAAALLAKKMQVPMSYITKHLYRVKGMVCTPPQSPRGTWLGCFALRAGLSKGSHWDIMVRTDKPDRLPCVPLSNVMLDEDAMDVIQQLDGLNITECLDILEERPQSDRPIADVDFGGTLYERIKELSLVVGEPFFMNAVFSSRMVRMPTFNHVTGHATACNLLVFHIIPDIHEASLSASTLVCYSSLSFFQVRQKSLSGAPHHSSFDRKVHNEFGSFLIPQEVELQGVNTSRASSGTSEVLKKSTGWLTTSSRKSAVLDSKEPNSIKSPALKIKHLSNKFVNRHSSHESGNEFGNERHSTVGDIPWGGILVSTDLTVTAEIRAKDSADPEAPRLETGYGMGSMAYAGTADAEIPTYVDELFQVAVQRWQSSRR